MALLHEISKLLHRSLELEAACYAVLTGVTAGVGLGFNRAMLFLTARDDRSMLEGTMAVGPADKVETDRVWRQIEAGDDDLQHPLRVGAGGARRTGAHRSPGARACGCPSTADSLIARALKEQAVVRSGGDLEGLLDLETGIAAPLTTASGVVGVLYADNRFTGKACSR